jgi:hypothetical protein
VAADAAIFELRDRRDVLAALGKSSIMMTGSTRLQSSSAFVGAATLKRLQFWQQACGCQVAAWASLLTIGLAISRAWPIEGIDVWVMAYTAGQAIMAAIVAKFAAIVAARAILAAELARLAFRSNTGSRSWLEWKS